VISRVLVVDDEPQIRKTLEVNLRARRYEVDLASTGEEALDLAARHHPDVVILDLGLPGIDGIDVVRGLRGWSQVPIVILSVRERESDKVAALDAGADDYVTKPFGMDELLARLRAALRRAAPADEEAVVTTDDFTIDLAAKRVTSADGDEIRLGSSLYGGKASFWVTDTGPGVAERDAERIFQRFTRGTNGGQSRDRRSGAGLGLAIVRAITGAHRATIRAENNSAGSGMKVVLEFPVPEAAS